VNATKDEKIKEDTNGKENIVGIKNGDKYTNKY
jgi:hypothetical protein